MLRSICLLIMLVIFTGCSSEPSLKLIYSSVDTSEDCAGSFEISEGDRKGDKIGIVSLNYDIVLQNTGQKNLGKVEEPNKFTYENGINLFIEPNEKLQTVMEEITGFNLFSEEDREKASLGWGSESVPYLAPNQADNYALHFDLGAAEENVEMSIAPTKEQLARLKDVALDAVLIIQLEGEEIARFNLR